ncbi:MAG: hypothetical protein ACTSU5_06405 [Promethearchaeota archaeon]
MTRKGPVYTIGTGLIVLLFTSSFFPLVSATGAFERAATVMPAPSRGEILVDSFEIPWQVRVMEGLGGKYSFFFEQHGGDPCNHTAAYIRYRNSPDGEVLEEFELVAFGNAPTNRELELVSFHLFRRAELWLDWDCNSSGNVTLGVKFSWKGNVPPFYTAQFALFALAGVLVAVGVVITLKK